MRRDAVERKRMGLREEEKKRKCESDEEERVEEEEKQEDDYRTGNEGNTRVDSRIFDETVFGSLFYDTICSYFFLLECSFFVTFFDVSLFVITLFLLCFLWDIFYCELFCHEAFLSCFSGCLRSESATL